MEAKPKLEFLDSKRNFFVYEFKCVQKLMKKIVVLNNCVYLVPLFLIP